MTMPETKRPRSPRLLDLVGLVLGYGMAAMLVRSFWPSSKPLVGIPAIALTLEYLWLGLAMSGPIVLLLDRRGGTSPPGPRRPKLGRLISAREPIDTSPVGRGPSRSDSTEAGPYTRAEWSWMLIGSYWIALTLLLVPALSMHEIAGFIGMTQLVIIATILVFLVPKRAKPEVPAESWTHAAALGLLWTWPIAWVLLILLSRGL